MVNSKCTAYNTLLGIAINYVAQTSTLASQVLKLQACTLPDQEIVNFYPNNLIKMTMMGNNPSTCKAKQEDGDFDVSLSYGATAYIR